MKQAPKLGSLWTGHPPGAIGGTYAVAQIYSDLKYQDRVVLLIRHAPEMEVKNLDAIRVSLNRFWPGYFSPAIKHKK
jgi:hypothetical protein